MLEALNAIITFTAASVIFFVGLFVYLKDRKNTSKNLFALFALSVALWIINNYLTVNFYGQDVLLFWGRTNMLLAVVQSITFFLFAHTFPAGKFLLSKTKRIVLFAFSSLTAVACYSPFLFSGLEIDNESLINPVVGPGIILFIIHSIGLIISGIFLLAKKFISSTGVVKHQIGYILLGASVMFSMLIILNFLLIVVFKNSRYIFLGAADTIPFIVLTWYAMTRYRFMDIKVVLKKSVVYGTALLCTVGLYVYLLWFAYSLLPSVIVWIFGLLIYTLLWNVYSRKLKYALDRLFFMDELDLSKRIDERLHKLNSTYELETFAVELIRTIEDTVHTPVHSMYIAEREHNHFRLYYPQGVRGSISFNDEFVGALNKMSSIIIKDEIELQDSDANRKVVKELKKRNASVILQIQKDHAPIGIIFIGSKEDQKPYLSNEIHELQRIVSNAQLQLPAVIQYHEAIEGARKTIHEASYTAENNTH